MGQVVEITAKPASVRRKASQMPVIRKQMLDSFDHNPDIERVRRQFELTSNVETLAALFAQDRAERRAEAHRRRNGWAA